MIQQQWKKRCGMGFIYVVSLFWCGVLLKCDFLPSTIETPMIDAPANTKKVLEAVELSSAHNNVVNRQQKQATACVPPDATVTNPVTGFNLTCPCNSPADLPTGIREVKLFYHVGMMNNWKEIVEDQLTTLNKCGLGHYASSLTISYTNGEPQELMDVLNNFSIFHVNTGKVNVTLLPGPKAAPWETRSINAVYEACQDAHDDGRDGNNIRSNSTMDKKQNKGDVVVFYFHNKGASKYTSTWKDELDREWSYSRALYWRKYLEYFILERPGLCLNAFADGAYTCGVELEKKHYSGNFWALTCQYVIKSKMKGMKGAANPFYSAAEYWIGRGMLDHEADKHVGLFDRGWSLYKHLVLPKEYAIQNEDKALKIASSISIISLYKNNKQERASVFKSLLDPVITPTGSSPP